MAAERDPDGGRLPLIRFILFAAPGFVALTLLSWSLATWGPRWLPNGEKLVMILAMLFVFVAVLHARLRTLTDAVGAVAISVVLQLLIYYGPLLYLLDASYNRILVREMGGIAGMHAASYALAVAAALVLMAVLNRKVKAE